MNETTNRLVGGDELLQKLFDDGSRPSMRWLRTMTKNRVLPYVRIGRLVFFDPVMVRSYLEKKRTVTSAQ